MRGVEILSLEPRRRRSLVSKNTREKMEDHLFLGNTGFMVKNGQTWF